jgi:hypothetical protein
MKWMTAFQYYTGVLVVFVALTKTDCTCVGHENKKVQKKIFLTGEMQTQNITINTLDQNSCGENVICTTKIHALTTSFSRKLRSSDDYAALSLVYFPSMMKVQSTYPYKPPIELVPFSPDAKVAIEDDLKATFKFKVNPLSSHHNQAQFCFCVTTGETSAYSKPFKTLSKLCRKRTIHTSHESSPNGSLQNGHCNEDEMLNFDWILDSTLSELELPSSTNACQCRCEELHNKLDLLLMKVDLIEKRLKDKDEDDVSLVSCHDGFESGTEEISEDISKRHETRPVVGFGKPVAHASNVPDHATIACAMQK